MKLIRMKLILVPIGAIGFIALIAYLFTIYGGINLIIPAEEQLFDAVSKRDLVRVNEILKSGKVKNIDKGFGGSGTSALIRAVENNEIEIVKVLIQAGANVNFEAQGRVTALHMAAYFGYLEAARLLIQHDANLDIPEDQNSLTPLHEAIWKRHVDVARLLVESGANIDAMTGDGRNAIIMARRLDNDQFASWLERRIQKNVATD